MLKQFPYSVKKSEAKYTVEFNRYNYTGMYFDADNLTTVNDVDPDSPAFIAGIRSGYLIRNINDKKFNQTKEDLSAGYKNFITETMVLRDPATRFVNAEGFSECMFWNVAYYSEIMKEFNKPEYLANFSYLYGFEKYINPRNDNRLTIEAWDGSHRRVFQFTPQIRQSVTIKVE
jgi:hypothetical protein